MPNAKELTIDTNFFKAFCIGDFGTGKSVFASSFPTPGYVFDFDNGIETFIGKDFEYDQFQLSPTGWVAFEKKYIEIKKRAEAGEFKTVILDSTTTMTDVAMERALQLDPKRTTTGGPMWNVHYQMVRNLMEPKLRGIFNLPCHIVMNGHLEIIMDQETGAIIGAEPLLTGRLRKSVPGYFSEVYYFFTKMKEGKVQYVLRTVPRGYYKARSRISGEARVLPDEVANSYHAIRAAYDKGKEALEKKTASAAGTVAKT